MHDLQGVRGMGREATPTIRLKGRSDYGTKVAWDDQAADGDRPKLAFREAGAFTDHRACGCGNAPPPGRSIQAGRWSS
jgi:hypothetical protein